MSKFETINSCPNGIFLTNRNYQSRVDDSIIHARNKFNVIKILERNAIYVVGIPENFANPKALASMEFFGQYGRIISVEMKKKSYIDYTTGVKLFSAYIRYSHPYEALIAICALDSLRHEYLSSLRASIGTTRYCKNFLFKENCLNFPP